MLRLVLQAAIAGHCSRALWDGEGVRPLCRGVFQSAPDYQLLAIIGVADVSKPALRAARKAGFLSEVRLVVPERGQDIDLVGPSRYMLDEEWTRLVGEMADGLKLGDRVMLGAEVWVADEELSSLALLLSSATIREQLRAHGIDVPAEEYLRARLDERRCLFPQLLDFEVEAEVKQMMKDVA